MERSKVSPARGGIGCGTVLALLVVGLLIAQCAGTASRPQRPPLTAAELEIKDKKERDFQLVVLGAQRLKDSMKKPETFKLVDAALMKDGSICYTYRARNSFNDEREDYYVVTPLAGSNKPSDWNKYCAGKAGENFTYARQALR